VRALERVFYFLIAALVLALVARPLERLGLALFVRRLRWELALSESIHRNRATRRRYGWTRHAYARMSAACPRPSWPSLGAGPSSATAS